MELIERTGFTYIHYCMDNSSWEVAIEDRELNLGFMTT